MVFMGCNVVWGIWDVDIDVVWNKDVTFILPGNSSGEFLSKVKHLQYELWHNWGARCLLNFITKSFKCN